MAVKGGRVVKTPKKKKPYKVVLEDERRAVAENPVGDRAGRAVSPTL